MESFTLPHGHPSEPRVTGGTETESEVESATISDSVEAPAPKKSRRRKVVAEPAPEVIEEPTEDKPEE